MTRRLAARRALVFVTLLAALASIACARDRETDPEPPEPAATPAQFAQRFERLTAVALDPGRDELYGITFEEPELPDRFQRFGTYTLVWAQSADQRELALGGEDAARPDREGIYWERVGDGWSASKPFGDHLVLQWVGPSTKTTTARWDRLERAVRAAYRGDSGVLTEAEQPCGEDDVDPIAAEPGQCSVDGIPVTFDDAEQALSTPALDVRVVGVETPAEIGQDTASPLSPEGRFVVVAYRIKNTGSEPIGFLLPALRLGGRTVEEDNRARSLLPESRAFPLEPGQTTELQTAYRRRRGARRARTRARCADPAGPARRGRRALRRHRPGLGPPRRGPERAARDAAGSKRGAVDPGGAARAARAAGHRRRPRLGAADRWQRPPPLHGQHLLPAA